MILMKAVLEQFWGCKPGQRGLREDKNKEVEGGGIGNCFQDNSYKSREKNRLVDEQMKT